MFEIRKGLGKRKFYGAFNNFSLLENDKFVFFKHGINHVEYEKNFTKK